MKVIDLENEKLDVLDLIDLARQEPVLLLTADGREFMFSQADDFDQEVAALRASRAFQQFLVERSASKNRIPLEEIERGIEQELADQGQAG